MMYSPISLISRNYGFFQELEMTIQQNSETLKHQQKWIVIGKWKLYYNAESFTSVILCISFFCSVLPVNVSEFSFGIRTIFSVKSKDTSLNLWKFLWKLDFFSCKVILFGCVYSVRELYFLLALLLLSSSHAHQWCYTEKYKIIIISKGKKGTK